MPTSSDRYPLTARAAADAVGALADPDRAQRMARYLQAGAGGYAQGDEFLGVAVPALRAIAKRCRGMSRDGVRTLLESPVHEIRHLALIIMGEACSRADDDVIRGWADDYVAALASGRVDNWDLVDSSAAPVLGLWCVRTGDLAPLVALATGTPLWSRRAGIVGGHAFLRRGDGGATLAVAPLVLDDRRPLIEKAFGWMLRELGARVDPTALTDYLDAHAAQMGRTALRYAVEHLDAEHRAHYRGLR